VIPNVIHHRQDTLDVLVILCNSKFRHLVGFEATKSGSFSDSQFCTETLLGLQCSAVIKNQICVYSV
jgi:hypothetical protein